MGSDEKRATQTQDFVKTTLTFSRAIMQASTPSRKIYVINKTENVCDHISRLFFTKNHEETL